ncbi:MAG: glycosyltransferase [Xanthomonadales bacterium]|nr:glycosyltransferase [Xanthomonadales bacterium]
MRLALVASGTYFSEYGGGQIYVRQLARELCNRGIDVHVLAVEQGAHTEARQPVPVDDSGVRVWRIAMHPDVAIATSRVIAQTAGAIGEAIGSIAPNIVHAHGWKAATARATYDLSLPCFITAHHGGIVCPNGMLMDHHERLCHVPTSPAACIRCATHFVPAGQIWNWVFSALPASRRTALANRCRTLPSIPYFTPALKVPLSVADKLEEIASISLPDCRVIAPSIAIERALLRNGLSRSQVMLLAHGSALPRVATNIRHNPDTKLRLGYIGRIDRVKGLHVLIDALKIMPDPGAFVLHVFGAAATRRELRYFNQLKHRSSGLPVIWRDKLAHERISEAYADIDVLVFPSICTEAFGLSVAEAVLAGKTVVTSRCGGPEDIVRDGVDGFIVNANDSAALAQRLQQLVVDRSLLVPLGHVAPHVLSVDAHVDALLDLYRRSEARFTTTAPA